MLGPVETLLLLWLSGIVLAITVSSSCHCCFSLPIIAVTISVIVILGVTSIFNCHP